jgi:hypothetical protein
MKNDWKEEKEEFEIQIKSLEEENSKCIETLIKHSKSGSNNKSVDMQSPVSQNIEIEQKEQ